MEVEEEVQQYRGVPCARCPVQPRPPSAGFRFGDWGLRIWVWGLGFGVWDVGLMVQGLCFGLWGLGLGGLGFGSQGVAVHRTNIVHVVRS